MRFSIGVSGSYLLYVSLRQPRTPWASPGTAAHHQPPLRDDWQVAGSPFLLTVAPGKAYPLSTSIPSDALPLRGSRDAGDKEGYTCELLLQSRDKMGNRCER